MEEPIKDRLGILFSEIRPDSPSDNFTAEVMSKIRKRENRKNIRRQWLSMLLFPCIGIITMITALFFVLDLTGIEIHLNISEMVKNGIQINPVYLMFALPVIILLIADSFIRNFINNKKAAPRNHI